MASPTEPPAAAPSAPRRYNVVSANYLDREYPDGVLYADVEKSEIELRELTGKKKKDEVVVARFRMEYNAQVLTDGPVLKVSELSITLESPTVAEEVAGILRHPIKVRAVSKVLSDAEASVGEFLREREEALSLISLMKTDPRSALLSAESAWTDESVDPLEAVYSAYSARLAASLEKMKSSLEGAEPQLGAGLTDTLYTLAYTVGNVQDALFEPDSLDQQVAALQELGISTTAQDLRMEKPTERLMVRAHEVLDALAKTPPPQAELPKPDSA